MSQAFSGLRVIDFSQVISGPLAAQQLAHLGAEVIKVEPLGAGDQMRGLLTDNETARARLAPAFLTINISKKSLALNMKHPSSARVMERLLKDADVVVENFRPSVADRLGIGYEDVCKLSPDVIYCSISGYGQDGPRGKDAAYDGAIQAMAGLMSLNGHADTGPTRTQYLAVDTMTGMVAAFSIAAAIARKARTGEGQRLDVSMYDSALLLAAGHVANYTMKGVESPLIGNGSPVKYPTSDSFRTADGYIMIMALSDAHAMATFDVLGLSHFTQDSRFQTAEDRRDHYDEIQSAMRERFLTDGSEEWAEKLKARGVALSVVRDVAAAVVDPQLAYRDVMVETDGIEGVDGSARLVGAAFKADRDGPSVSGPPPGKVGQHSNEILSRIGFSDAEIAGLASEGLFGQQ